jgi:hypothetical protein
VGHGTLRICSEFQKAQRNKVIDLD